MRSDMSKVVTERPRRGSGLPSMKTALRINAKDYEADDHGPTRAPMSMLRQGRMGGKQFSDLIGPLRRYLRKQIGRPWNKVHAELAKHLDRRSMTGLHIWQHVDSEVERDVHMHNGVPFTNGLYVHPRTGVLREVPRYVWSSRYRGPEKNPEVTLPDGSKCERIEGIWYRITTTAYTVRWFETTTNKFETRTYYKTHKRQLGKRELRREGLRNIIQEAA